MSKNRRGGHPEGETQERERIRMAEIQWIPKREREREGGWERTWNFNNGT